MYFGNDGSQNYLIFQPGFKHFLLIKVSEQRITAPATSDKL